MNEELHILLGRVASLERANRRLRRLFVAVIFAAGILGGLASRFPSALAQTEPATTGPGAVYHNEVWASRFVLVGKPTGRIHEFKRSDVKAELATRSDGALTYLEFHTPTGVNRVSLHSNDGGLAGLTISDEMGNTVYSTPTKYDK